MFRFSVFPVHWFSFLLVINGIAPSFSQGDCGESDMKKCMDVIERVVENPNIAFPDSENDLEVGCRYYMQFVNCITNMGERCFKSLQKDAFLATFSGITAFVSDMCTPGNSYRNDFLKHSSCYRSVESDLQQCVNTYQAESEALKTEDLSAEETIKKSCCYMDGATDCLVRPTVKKCGNEAADLIRKASDKIYGPLTIICSSVKYDSAECSSASSVTISGFLWLAFIIILSLNH